MTREDYLADLDALLDGGVDMGDLVLDRLDDALAALDEGDDELARGVVTGDDAVNERYLDLKGDCIDPLALQQPVASDPSLIY